MAKSAEEQAAEKSGGVELDASELSAELARLRAIDPRKAQGMGYEDAVEARVTREQARAQIKRQNVCECGGCASVTQVRTGKVYLGELCPEVWADFVRQYGERETYRGGDVLDFCGF